MTPFGSTALCLALILGSPAFGQAPLPAQLDGIVTQAQIDGLPGAALEAKALEGLAKGVPVARIAAVLEGMAGDLAAADLALAELGTGPDRDELIAAAALAREAGMSDGGVRELARQQAWIRARALQASADLLRLGFSEHDTIELVRMAATSDEALESISGLATAASVLVSSGLSPTAAASRLSSEGGSTKQHPLANVPPQSRSDLPEPAQNAPGKGPKGPK